MLYIFQSRYLLTRFLGSYNNWAVLGAGTLKSLTKKSTIVFISTEQKTEIY